MKRLKSFLSSKKPDEKPDTDSIFELARSWADDIYSSNVAKAHLFQLASIGLLGLCMILSIAIAFLLPLKKTELIVVHKSNDGVVWVDPPSSLQAPNAVPQLESEIVNYVINRESYSAFSFDTQYETVNLMSDDAVAKEYRKQQDAGNEASPIHQLGEDGKRTVQIDNVIFLDNEALNSKKSGAGEKHENRAQVNFEVTIDEGYRVTVTPYTALLSWTYRGTPNEPVAKWKNWDGFIVTQYVLTQRNITH